MQTTNILKKNANAQPTRERIIEAARKLFDSKGFHEATTAELAAEAGVNIGLIYRHFESKDDIVLTIGERKTEEHIAWKNATFDAVKRGELSVFDAIKAFAYERLADSEGGLFFEVLAESFRNRLVAERMRTLMATYHEGIRQLAALVRPDAPPKKLDAYADLMIACFTGLGYRTAIYRTAIGIAENAEETSYEIARLLMTVGLPESQLPEPQPKVSSRGAPRSSPKRKRG